MGVKIKDLIVDTRKIIVEKNLFGKTVAIDSYITLFQFLNTVRSFDGRIFTDLNGNTTSHLIGLLYRMLYFKEKNITPIFVFDGKPNPLKHEELKRRFENYRDKHYAYKEAQDIGTIEDKNKTYINPKLNVQMLEDTFYLLKNLGATIVKAPQDGESQCVQLVNEGKAFATVSQDYDTFLFGSKRIIRNLSKTKKRKVMGRTVNFNIEYYTIDKVLDHLKLTQSQLIDLGLLVGTDFTKGTKGIGSKTALELIKKYGDISTICDKQPIIRGIKLELDKELMMKAKCIFSNPNVTKNIEIKKNKPDFNNVNEFLLSKNFNEIRLEKTLNKFRDLTYSKKQISLDGFFK